MVEVKDSDLPMMLQLCMDRELVELAKSWVKEPGGENEKKLIRACDSLGLDPDRMFDELHHARQDLVRKLLHPSQA